MNDVNVRAIDLQAMARDDELRFRVLAEVVGDDKLARRVDFTAIAEKLNVSRQLVAYHVRQLVASGFLAATINGYAPTDKILIINKPTQIL